MKRRVLLRAVRGALFLPLLPLLGNEQTAFASEFPSKPIRIVVPYPPGGSSDAMARLLGERLTRSLGQPVLIDNRPGASEQIAAGIVAKSVPDGYTIMLASTVALSVNPSHIDQLGNPQMEEGYPNGTYQR